MFLSLAQVESSLSRLANLHPFFGIAFFAFKKAKLLIGKTQPIVVSRIYEEILQNHFRVTDSYKGFYSPFATSSPSERWQKPRYGSTSLQRIVADTFGDVFLHEKRSSDWGWKPDYISQLEKHQQGQRIPAFDLAVWLFRDVEWSKNTSRQDVVEHLFSEFQITDNERRRLFDTSLPEEPQEWLSSKPLTENELLDSIGQPPGAKPAEGACLRWLEIDEIGPARKFRYEPGERLNLITGDNSLGKTFLLDLIWWALTETWSGFEALPRKEAPKMKPSISFEVNATSRRAKPLIAEYNWRGQAWEIKPKREATAGIVIYARFNGAFAVWDPARAALSEPASDQGKGEVLFEPSEVWNGLKAATSRGDQWICNGLLLDWIRWQTSGEDYRTRFDALCSCLSALSPSIDEPLRPGNPQRRLKLGSRELPTIKMPYGDVPVQLASAGIQRVLALAYILVWSWHEHLAITSDLRIKPQRRMVLLVDEVEAHLHPRWQRVIVPALINVIEELTHDLTPQIHLATHSPLVMASTEPCFQEDRDKLHHLRLDGQNVVLEELPFVKRGRADLWLMSDAFGLDQARSVPASQAIETAKRLQQDKSPNPMDVSDTHRLLVQHLAPDDEFWPLWLFFAKQHGVSL